MSQIQIPSISELPTDEQELPEGQYLVERLVAKRECPVCHLACSYINLDMCIAIHDYNIIATYEVASIRKSSCTELCTHEVAN